MYPEITAPAYVLRDPGRLVAPLHSGGGLADHVRWLLIGIAFVGLGVSCGWAHDPGISTAQGELRAGSLVLTTGFAPADVEALLPGTVPRAERWGQAEFEAAREHLLRLAPQMWEIRAGETRLPLQEVRVELLPGDNVSFHHRVSFAAGSKRITLRLAKIADLPAGHRQFVIISDERGSTITKKLLSARDFTLEVPLQK
jgi:hypothetical protein